MEVLLRGQTGQLGVIVAHLVVDELNEVLTGEHAQQAVLFVEDGDGVLGVILQPLDALIHRLPRVNEGEGGGDEPIQRVALPGDDEVLQVESAAVAAVLVQRENGTDVVVLRRLSNDGAHGLLDGQALRHGDVVHAHMATDLVLREGVEQGDLRPAGGVQQLHHVGAVLGGQSAEDVHQPLGIQPVEHRRALFQLQLAKIFRRLLVVLAVLQHIGQHVRGQHGKEPLADHRGHGLQCVGKVAGVVVLQPLGHGLWGQVPGQNGKNFTVVVRLGGRTVLVLLVVHLLSLRFVCVLPAGRPLRDGHK